MDLSRRTFLGTALAGAAGLPALGAADPDQPRLLLGAAWYPEHWPESRWPRDVELMKDARIHMVRVAEFAWSRMEPEEGRFDLDWLERAIALAARSGIVTVVGTPTAAPPAWLTERYPDTLKIDEHGRRAEHGMRAHFSFTSPRYREFCRRIAAEMAKRFGRNPNVVGWQIDNEYGEVSYDDFTRGRWHDWLKARYGSLEEMNRRWTTEYWSQTYTGWSQVPFGLPGNNPGLMLDFKRFITDAYRDYQHVQVAALREHAEPRQFITSNFMGWYDSFDHYALTAELDLASWDNYVGTGHLDPLRNGIVHDLTRGFKRKNFWVMETQPGSVNWAEVNNALDRGEVRAMAWHAIGHGADTVSYWQWRSALNGQEQIHGTLVGADGEPVPLYEEVARIGREFELASSVLAGTSPRPRAALLHSYESRWSVNWQRHNKDFDPSRLLTEFYAPLRTLAQDLDVVHPMAPLEQYSLVVAPALNVLPAAMAQHLAGYVRNGGHLVLGPRSGLKDEYNSLNTERQPGPLAALLGGRVEQYYALEKEVPVRGAWGTGTARIWAEHLKPREREAEVLATYGESNGWLDGQPAALTRKAGKGRITYIGAWLEAPLMRAAAAWMLQASGVRPAFGPVPEGVEVSRRTGQGREVFVIVNHTRARQQVKLPRPMRAILGGVASVTELDLPPRGVEVLA
jgi:beta-galactosidase